MVQRIEEPKEIKSENDIPMIPNYSDLLLGELNASRILLEKIELNTRKH